MPRAHRVVSAPSGWAAAVVWAGLPESAVWVVAHLDAEREAARLRVLLDGLRLQLITTARQASTGWALAVLDDYLTALTAPPGATRTAATADQQAADQQAADQQAADQQTADQQTGDRQTGDR